MCIRHIISTQSTGPAGGPRHQIVYLCLCWQIERPSRMKRPRSTTSMHGHWPLKVRGHYVANLVNWTPILEWYKKYIVSNTNGISEEYVLIIKMVGVFQFLIRTIKRIPTHKTHCFNIVCKSYKSLKLRLQVTEHHHLYRMFRVCTSP